MPAIAHQNKILGNTSGGGSTIRVTTSESSLYGQTITLSDGTTTLSGTFSNTGECEFTGVMMTGNLTLACGGVSQSISVPYFGNYSFVFSLFSATVNVTYPYAEGATCTLSDGTTTLIATGSPMAFTVPNAGAWTASVELDGNTKTTTTYITTDGQVASIIIVFGTINVTYDNDFRGVSITCTLGATTITKTAPTTGNTMSFYPPTTGQWTISGTVGGVSYPTTANVTSLSTPVSVNLETIPNGSTATPTDDIQKWLACAGIKDKAYTTLSQVLGDSETYNALLGDSNACAYMKRSTTWSTDICASQYAMNLLGQYDTACDALLSDATWTTALNNSSYWSGHTDSGVLIHGGNPASNEQFYYMDGGQQQLVSNPANLDAGTYTIYSNLAKAPTDLSADYGKTVRICPNTKEIVVRPDSVMYWWGYDVGKLEWCTTENGWSGFGSARGGKEDTKSTTYIPVSRKSDGYYYVVGTKEAVTGVVNQTKEVVIVQFVSGDKSNCNPCGGKTTKILSGGTTNPPYTELQTENLEKNESVFTSVTSYLSLSGSSSREWSYNLYAIWLE